MPEPSPIIAPTSKPEQRGMSALADAALDAVARAVADVRREADRAEQLRAAEHRAFMAEQRESLAEMRRAIEVRLAEVKDGRDGVDGKDGQDGRDADMDALTKQIECLVAQIPVPENGKDGRDGERGEKGESGAAGERGEQGPAGSDGANGVDGRDGVDADMDALKQHIEELVAAIPAPKDGKDGADGKDAYPGAAKGLFSPEAEYLARDVVQLNGSAWMAKIDGPGDCPGEGWMLLAGRGKRGDRGDKGERGIEGKSGKDGAQPVGLAIDAQTMEFRMILDNGEECAADFYPIAQAIRGE